MLWIIPVVLLSGFVLSGPIMSDVEQAQYTVVSTDGDYEIRDYAPSLVAETEVTGERKDAIGQGFRTIADYIFGNNQSHDSVSMTAPVIQESSQQISMTAPVSQEESGAGWKVRFGMPATYSLETLPKPNNPDIHLVQVPGKKVVVVEFSGLANDELLHEKESDLRNYIQSKELKPLGSPIYAFYNPPWTLPFLRRNEVMWQIEK